MTTDLNQNAPATTDEKPEDKQPVNAELNLVPDEKPVVAPVADTGDAALDLALNFFATVGVTQDHPALKHAATTGDFALVEAVLKDKGETAKGFAPYLKIAQQQFERQRSEQTEGAAKAKALVFAAVGGEAQWATIRAWAVANATPEEAKAVNAQLQAGGEQAKIAAKYLASAWTRAQAKAPREGADALKPGAQRGAPATGTVLNPTEYQRAVAQLSAKVGTGNLESNPEFQQLRARRLAWKG